MKLNLAARFRAFINPPLSPSAAFPARFNPTAPADGRGYENAKPSTRRGRIDTSAPTDGRLELPSYTRSELVRKARYQRKNSGFLRQVAQDMRLFGVGDGIQAQPTTENTDWNLAALKVWEDFCRAPDISRRFSLTTFQHLITNALKWDGEVFVIKVRDRNGLCAIQIIESHRCHNGDNPPSRMVDGVQIDETGRPLMYRFERDDGTFRDVPAGAVMHVYDPEDYSSTRYAPAIQHALNNVQDVQEILSQEKTNVKEDGRTARVLKRGKKPTTEEDDDIRYTGKVDPRDVEEGTDPETVTKVFGGETVAIENDESLESYQSKRPSATFSGFIDSLHRDSASGLLPYEFIHDPSSVGGAGVRLVVGKAGRVFSEHQRILIERFLNPLWAWVIADAIVTGELNDQDGWYVCDWTPPRSVTVDAGRDAKANRDDLIFGNRTFHDDFAERGAKFHQEMRRRAQEARFILDLAKEYEVPPAMLFNPSPSSSATAATADAQDSADQAPHRDTVPDGTDAEDDADAAEEDGAGD